jgi:hypothetical protein
MFENSDEIWNLSGDLYAGKEDSMLLKPDPFTYLDLCGKFGGKSEFRILLVT